MSQRPDRLPDRRSAVYPPADALVAIAKTPHDFAIARDQHWYRIPCQSAPPVLERARWLAFYFPKPFGEQRWAIHYIAPIERIDRALRRELLPGERDHRRATEEYFRVQLGSVEPLPRPVASARQRRIVFIATTVSKLRNATEINDLYHDSPLEDRLWSGLRAEGVAAERQWPVNHHDVSYFLDFHVPCTRGSLDVECDGDTWHLGSEAVVADNERDNCLAGLGWTVLRFGSRQLRSEAISSVVEQIRRTAERFGGLALPGAVTRRFASGGAIVEQPRLFYPSRG